MFTSIPALTISGSVRGSEAILHDIVLDEKSDLMARSAPRIPRAGKIGHVILKQRDDLTVHTKSVFPSATAEATLYAFGDGRQHRGPRLRAYFPPFDRDFATAWGLTV